MSLPDKQENSLVKLINDNIYIFIVFGGMVAYQIHRLIFWLIDEIFFKCRGHTCWTFFKIRYGKVEQVGAPKNNKDEEHTAREAHAIIGYMDYRWSILHSCLITAELGFLFSWLARDCSLVHEYREPIRWCSVVLFSIALWMYCYLTKIELEEISKWDNASNKAGDK